MNTKRFLFLTVLNLVIASVVLGQSDSTSFERREEQDSSFVIISAIKSVAGVRPANEFFDINLKFLNAGPLMTLASFDVALTEVNTDSASSPQKKFTEAGILMNVMTRHGGPRSFLAGGVFKIFNEIPYIGIDMGGIELNASDLVSSYVYVGFLWRLKPIDEQEMIVDGVRQSYQNVYIEFALHTRNQKIGILNSLRIKGGVLMPLKDSQVTGTHSRIVIEVPIGGIIPF